jgi:hypothetical protein
MVTAMRTSNVNHSYVYLSKFLDGLKFGVRVVFHPDNSRVDLYLVYIVPTQAQFVCV